MQDAVMANNNFPKFLHNFWNNIHIERETNQLRAMAYLHEPNIAFDPHLDINFFVYFQPVYFQ